MKVLIVLVALVCLPACLAPVEAGEVGPLDAQPAVNEPESPTLPLPPPVNEPDVSDPEEPEPHPWAVPVDVNEPDARPVDPCCEGCPGLSGPGQPTCCSC